MQNQNITNEVKYFTYQLEKKDIIKDTDPDWLYFNSYASVFGNTDLGDDIIVKGAFEKTLSSGNNINLLYNHDWDKPIGKTLQLNEDETGLYVKGAVSKTQNTDWSRTVIDGIQKSYINELSIGFRVKACDFRKKPEAKNDYDVIREIKEVELYEVSLVNKAMNPLAKILNFKNWDNTDIKDIRALEKELKSQGMSTADAKTLISICKSTLKSEIESKFQQTRDEELKQAFAQGKREVELQLIINGLNNINQQLKINN